MAGDFLRQHGIDINAEMDRIQHGLQQPADPVAENAGKVSGILNASLPNTAPNARHDIHFNSANEVAIISPSIPTQESFTPQQQTFLNAQGALVTPSLCHPHIHLDKPFLLSHPKYSDLQLTRGDFSEAMELTGKAKAKFARADLLERGQRLIDESVAAGVTHMRAFVEVDAGVGTKCLDAGIELKKAAEAQGRCTVQICAFAQLPLFTASQGDEEGAVIRGLMEDAASQAEVDVVGSTPYVEGDRGKMERNVEWMVELSAKFMVHLDFHLDYNLDPEVEPLVWHVVSTLKLLDWKSKTQAEKTVMLGHCTRLTLFTDDQWRSLADDIKQAELPISFVGLPTSDLFIMPFPPPSTSTRRTLDVPRLIKDFDLNACLGVNNIGNAFTPQGSCDPLTLACSGVAVYQAGTKLDAELLYECVSTRARAAIGLGRAAHGSGKDVSLDVKGGDSSLLVFGSETEKWRTRSFVSETVYMYDHCRGRKVVSGGRIIR